MLQKIYATLSFLTKLVVMLFQDIYWQLSSKKYNNINNDIILITGGGRGIGKELALEFVKHQPKHIIVCGRTEASLIQTAKEVQDKGVNCAYMICDISNREQVFSLAKEVSAKFGHVTILINNAGIVCADSILEAKAEDMLVQINTNTVAHFWTTKAFLPAMLESNHGHIVSINSMLGWAGLNGAAGYTASKFASSIFSDSLQEELLENDDIHVTTIYPFVVDNDMFSGVTNRFPTLFPAIDQSYVAYKTVEAVLTNRSKVLVPKVMYIIAVFYSIAPLGAITEIMKFLHVNKSIQQMKDSQQKVHSKTTLSH